MSGGRRVGLLARESGARAARSSAPTPRGPRRPGGWLAPWAAAPPELRLYLRIAGAAVVVLVLVARLTWGLPAVTEFVTRYPGVAGGAVHEGTPAWVGALHALNLFFLTLIVRSGLEIRRSRRPAGHWTRRRPRRGRGTTITLEQWFHVSVDLVWLAIGAVYVGLLFGSGRWVRLVPTNWDVIPNAASVAWQYLSLHWPHEDGWVAYNALQMLAYCAVVFVLAPLAALTGLRMSALWPRDARVNRWFPVERARAVHVPVLVAFVLFVVVHVGLVLSTGAVRALNHMFAARDDDSLVGVLVLVGVLAACVGAMLAVRPVVLRTLAALTGKVTR